MPAYVQNGWGASQPGWQQDGRQPAQNYQQQPYQNPPQAPQRPQQAEQLQQRMDDPFQAQHQLGATFYPGAQDDYYMPPEVISPLPQRIMPELEQNVEDGLARLEIEASQNPRNNNRFDSSSSIVQPKTSPRHDDLGFPTAPPPFNPQQQQLPRSLEPTYSQSKPMNYEMMRRDFIEKQAARNMLDAPKFSPFPKPPNAGRTVPLSDDDEEDLLDRMRPVVLSSNDAELQLDWAQDSLAWVDSASSFAIRQQDGGQPARSITPKVEHQLRVDALDIVKFLGKQHHPKAEFMIGMWLEFGKFGHRVDKKEAFLSYRRAADKGYVRAEYRIGMQYEGTNNTPKAIEHYKKGVLLGDSASNYRLGMMTLLGQHGVTQDFQKGMELIKYAAQGADKNSPQGAYVYGMLVARELPNIEVPDQWLPYDMSEAKGFVEKAAMLGFAKAQFKMAQAYELCQLGVEFNPTLSLHYNALASRQGEVEADMAISKWFLCGFEGAFEKNEELAFTYAKRAASTKMAMAEFALGYFYEVGIHVPRDLRESEMWYNLAAEHGNTDALVRIDSIKKNSVLSKKDHERVAISRIKSQYGSRRGERPEKFKRNPPPPMPTLIDENLDMPDPWKSYSGTGAQRQPAIPQVQLPPAQTRPPVIKQSLPARPVSTAPYPEDDAPPKFTQARKPAAPYPLEDIGAGGLRPNPDTNLRLSPRPGPAADRPSSAFGIRPLVGTDSFGPVGRGRGDQRPATSMANMQPPGGRGQMPAGRGGWESKVSSNYLDSLPSQRPTLPQVESLDPRFSQRGPVNLNKPQPGRPLDQGFQSGPGPRPSSAGGPPQGQRPPSSHGGAGDPSHRRTNSGNQPGRPDSTNQFARPERVSSIAVAPLNINKPPTNARPERLDSRPPRVDSAPQGPAPVPAAGPKKSAPGKSGAGKNGPATFEEMGIPQSKQDSECALM